MCECVPLLRFVLFRYLIGIYQKSFSCNFCSAVIELDIWEPQNLILCLREKQEHRLRYYCDKISPFNEVKSITVIS